MKEIVSFLLMSFLFVAGANAESSINLNLPDSSSSWLIQVITIVTILGIAPSLLIMVTSFTRIAVVFSILRSALGLQQSPPNAVMISLALFLTFFIMMPTMQESYDLGLKPWIANEITEMEAFEKIAVPFHGFMRKQVKKEDLAVFMDIAKIEEVDNPEQIPYSVLVPSFMIGELRRAFEIGFLLFLPFLIIDLLVASILMTMGMMMMPPVVVSLPFKIIFFVLIDGWQLLSMSMVKSFGF